MNIVKKVKSLLKEAELYHKQGLLDEAMGKYNKAKELIQNDELLKSKQNLMDGISKKMGLLSKDIEKVEQAPKTPEVSADVRDLIKRLYTFSADQDDDTIALDGAIGLAKFGQYDSALLEFNELLKKESLRVVAAKNILRCHMAMSSVDEAFAQYEQWVSGDMFVPDQIDKLRIFFEGILEKEGVNRVLPTAKVQEEDGAHLIEMPEIDEPQIQETISEGIDIDGFEFEEDEAESDEILDINSIRLTVEGGSREGQTLELIVNFQSGNVISLLIPSRDKDLIECFKAGDTINNIEYYSPIAIFKSSGLVSGIVQIKTGPRRGDYNLDIKVVDN
jgi:tetratricopeptide (TPR) repeat protein